MEKLEAAVVLEVDSEGGFFSFESAPGMERFGGEDIVAEIVSVPEWD